MGETRAGLLDELAPTKTAGGCAPPHQHHARVAAAFSKLRSTYTTHCPSSFTRTRAHSYDYALASTTTGGLASSDPNLQNIPIRTKEGREIRTAFIAAPGMTLVICGLFADLNCACLRTLPTFRNRSVRSRGPRHSRHDGLRNVSGARARTMPPDVRGGGQRPSTSASSTAFPQSGLRTSSASRARSRCLHPHLLRALSGHIATTWTRRRRRFHAKGYVETIFGRRIHYPENQHEKPFDAAASWSALPINAPIKPGSAADIITAAMNRMECRFRRPARSRAHGCLMCTTNSCSR